MSEKKKKNSMLAYTVGVSERDKQKTKDYYRGEYDKKLKKVDKLGGRDPFTMIAGLGDAKKTKEREDAVIDASRYGASMQGKIADQNRWINRGARENALAQMKLKKKKA